jgi:hydrogenase expression/formation protein HypC
MCLAVPGELLTTEGDGLLRTGRVAFGGVSKDIALGYTPEAAVGDYVLVHAGMAIAVLDPDAAARSLDELDRLTTGGEGSP